MKRITPITTTAAAVLAAAMLPAVASAKGHHHRHHRKGASAHLQSFGPSSPTAPASDNAGTVASFTGGVLTIKLADGSTVTGKVTAATELKCAAAPASSMARMADHGGGGESGHDGSTDGQIQSSPAPVVESSDDNGQDANDADEVRPPAGEPPAGEPPARGEDDRNEACETSALKEGTTVHNAELSASATGATFLEVEIIL